MKRYYADNNHVVRWDSIMLDSDLFFEEELIAILDRQTRKLRSISIGLVNF